MTRLSIRFAGGAFMALAVFAAAPAFAADCPAGQVRANPLAGRPTAPRAVTDDVVGSIDLASEINVAGRDLRLRRLVVQPGGIVPFHSHDDRPALIITVSGSITEYRSTCAVPIEHPAGDVAREVRGTSHYWVNNGSVPAVLLSADVKAR